MAVHGQGPKAGDDRIQGQREGVVCCSREATKWSTSGAHPSGLTFSTREWNQATSSTLPPWTGGEPLTPKAPLFPVQKPCHLRRAGLFLLRPALTQPSPL